MEDRGGMIEGKSSKEETDNGTIQREHGGSEKARQSEGSITTSTNKYFCSDEMSPVHQKWRPNGRGHESHRGRGH
jgi:hypothetical protein